MRPQDPPAAQNSPSTLQPSTEPAIAPLPEARHSASNTPSSNTSVPDDEATPREYRIPLRTPNLENVRLKADDGLITLVARDGSLSDIITLLAETQGLNVVTADPLNVVVSITLDKVDLEDALDAVLSVAGYTWSIHKNIMYITSVSNAGNLSPQTQGIRLEVVTLDYAMARDVNTAITGLLSPVGSSFIMSSSDADSRQSREVVAFQDLPPYLERIREYIAQVDIPPRQVLIEVHVLQVDLDASNRNGVNLDQLFRRNGNLLFEFHSTGLAATNPSQAFTFRFSDGNMNALIEMLRTTTDAKTLASPRIMALSGQLSRIQVGEQLGFRVTTTTETSTTQSVDFLDVGVVLEVTPRISRDGRIMLSVRPEVSSGRVNPDTGLPEEKTTELDTDVLLCDNEGIVIGGLIQETDSDIRQGIARLSDLQILGGLFRRKETTKNRKEIIMALVPRLVPFHPAYDQFAHEKFQQSHMPLFDGPLEQTFRPWEARLPQHLLIPHGYGRDERYGHPGMYLPVDGFEPPPQWQATEDGMPYENQSPPQPASSVPVAPEPESVKALDPILQTPGSASPPSTNDATPPMEEMEPTEGSEQSAVEQVDPPPVYYFSRLPAVTPQPELAAARIIRRLPPIQSTTNGPLRTARGPARVTGLR